MRPSSSSLPAATLLAPGGGAGPAGTELNPVPMGPSACLRRLASRAGMRAGPYAAETELVERLFVSGVIAVGAVPALYWVIDHLTLRRR